MKLFKENLKEIYPDLKRVANNWMKYNNADDADDLVQKALLRALENQDQFKSGNFTGWVVRIMKNILIDECRKSKGRKFVDIDENTLEQYDYDNLEIFDVKKVINKLGGKCQKLLLLVGQEYKYKEIAEKLLLPIGTVTNSIMRCRKKLYKELYGGL